MKVEERGERGGGAVQVRGQSVSVYYEIGQIHKSV